MFGCAFVSGVQAAVAEQPGDGAFDFPSVASEALVGVDAALAMRGVMPRCRSMVRRCG